MPVIKPIIVAKVCFGNFSNIHFSKFENKISPLREPIVNTPIIIKSLWIKGSDRELKFKKIPLDKTIKSALTASTNNKL